MREESCASGAGVTIQHRKSTRFCPQISIAISAIEFRKILGQKLLLKRETNYDIDYVSSV
jgi:hypothetical protein